MIIHILFGLISVGLSILALQNMWLPNRFNVIACTLVTAILGNASTYAQICFNSSTAINGKAFPPLIDVTLEELITGLESNLFNSVDLVNAYVARINEVNSTLHAVTQLNPDALSIATQLDGERSAGKVRGPLHGIPILIKNNIATDDKMDNTAGSYALVGAKVPRDSTIAAKLRKAGAVILGKTNLSQWANWRSFNTSNGWSALGGQVYGPYYPGQDPSGSSSGSGVAGALGLALAALGSETSGSIISPAEVNNIVGIKPTVGLVSRDLVIPISEHQDTVGPMARTVKDAAYLLSAIAGKSQYDNYTDAIPFRKIPDYVSACKFSALKGKRLGVPRNVIDFPANNPFAASIDAFNAALDVLRHAGATVVDNTNFTGYEDFSNSEVSLYVLAADFISDLPKEYLSHLTYNPQKINSLADLENFTHSFPLEDWPERDTELWDLSLVNNLNNTNYGFWQNYTLNREYGGPQGVTGALKNYSLDALILPSNFAYSVPAVIGTPLVTVPLGAYPPDTEVTLNGFGDLNATGPNFPFGISFFAGPFSEELLIGLAYAFEQRTMIRNTIQPYIQPSTELVDIVNARLQSRKEL